MVVDCPKLVTRKISLYVNTFTKSRVLRVLIYKYCQYRHNGCPLSNVQVYAEEARNGEDICSCNKLKQTRIL